MRVVTWNMGYWLHRGQHDDAWQYLRDELKPDIALLQEVRPPPMNPGEEVVFEGIAGGWGTAIYSTVGPLASGVYPRYPGRIAGAHVDLDGSSVALASVHAPIIENRVFPHLANIFDDIEAELGGDTFVVGGDLNSARLAETIWPKYGHGPFFDRVTNGVFVDAHFTLNGEEVQTVFRPRARHRLQDDHLFVSRDLWPRLISCEAVDNPATRSLSDHIPLVLEIG